MNSPRSTRGTTLKTAYSNGLLTALLQGSNPPARLLETARQELHVGGTYRSGVCEPVSQPLLGNEVHNFAQNFVREPGSQRGVGLGYGSGEGQQHVVASSGERPLARGPPVPPGVWWKYSEAPWSMSHRRPCHMRRFGLRGVRSTLVTKASNHRMREARSGPGGSTRGSKPKDPGR